MLLRGALNILDGLSSSEAPAKSSMPTAHNHKVVSIFYYPHVTSTKFSNHFCYCQAQRDSITPKMDSMCKKHYDKIPFNNTPSEAPIPRKIFPLTLASSECKLPWKLDKEENLMANFNSDKPCHNHLAYT